MILDKIAGKKPFRQALKTHLVASTENLLILIVLLKSSDCFKIVICNGFILIFNKNAGNVYQWKSKKRVTSSDIRVTSSNTRVTSSNLRVTISDPRVTSLNPRVTSSNSQVMSSNPRVRRLKARVRRLKARVEAIKPRVKW